MRNLLHLAIAALLTVSFVAWQSGDVRAGEGYGKQKVVYHINSYGAKGQQAALRNIELRARVEPELTQRLSDLERFLPLVHPPLFALVFGWVGLRRARAGGGPTGPSVIGAVV